MTTPIDTILVAGSRAAGVRGELLRDYVDVSDDGATITFKERDPSGVVQDIPWQQGDGLSMIQASVLRLDQSELRNLPSNPITLADAGALFDYIQVEQIWAALYGASNVPNTTVRRVVGTSDGMTPTAADIAAILPADQFGRQVYDLATSSYSSGWPRTSGFRIPKYTVGAKYIFVGLSPGFPAPVAPARLYAPSPVGLSLPETISSWVALPDQYEVDGEMLNFWRSEDPLDAAIWFARFAELGYTPTDATFGGSVNTSSLASLLDDRNNRRPSVWTIHYRTSFRLFLQTGDDTLLFPRGFFDGGLESAGYARSARLLLAADPSQRGVVTATRLGSGNLYRGAPMKFGLLGSPFYGQSNDTVFSQEAWERYIEPITDFRLKMLVRYSMHDTREIYQQLVDQ